jgi:hypothetical protein
MSARGDDIEDNVILRVPPAIAERLRRLIKEGGAEAAGDAFTLLPLADDTSQSGHAATRSFAFALQTPGGGATRVMPAHLMDLPCIIEAQKTFDNISYYKAGDISQVCGHKFLRSKLAEYS